ncbi:MAG: TonB-dependent receptor plug domain-containing protein [Gilvibacter sp.]
MRKTNLFMLALLCASSFVVAQNNTTTQLDTVVVDSKIPLERKNSGKALTVITAEQLSSQKTKTVAQLLNQVVGFELNGSRSNEGQNLGYLVRGGRNRQVVVLIDGVAQSDGSQIANDFDLRLISTNSIDRIEILKGASSVLYGANAGTAVISITTKNGYEKPIGLNVFTSVGTNNGSEDSGIHGQGVVNSVQVGGQLSNTQYGVQFNHRYANGLSAIAAPEGEPSLDADPFNFYQLRVNLGHAFKNNIKINRSLTTTEYKTSFDNFDFTDANNTITSKVLNSAGQASFSYKKGSVIINDSYNWTRRETTSGFPTKFDSRAFGLDAYINHNFIDRINVVAGVNYLDSDFNGFSIPFGANTFAQDVNESQVNFQILDPYINLVYITDFGLNLNAGARLNTHSNYDNTLVYQVNPSYRRTWGKVAAKLMASYSTAYITPSLFQLFDPLYGNSELIPEENTTIEAGLEATIANNITFSLVYFNRNEQNFVDFVTVDPDLFIFQYQNIAEEFMASGVEFTGSYKKDKLNTTVNYTYTQTDMRFALRVPEHKANFALGYTPSNKWQLGLNMSYTSDREDAFFNPVTFEQENITLESYSLVGLNAIYKINKALHLSLDVSNLFNTEYEELYRYQTLGRNYSLGANISL